MRGTLGAKGVLGAWWRLAGWCALVCAGWLVAGLAGCAPPLRSGEYQCEPDDAGGCPSGWLCQCRGAACEWRCYSSEGGFCGDGELGEGEECDGAALADAQACAGDGFPYCRVDCRMACTRCGDGKLEATPSDEREECDDGNRIDGDGCSATCTLARCGDGFIDEVLFETCDLGDANSNAPDAPCRRDCHLRRCGDGITDVLAGERCDDGNLDPADACTPDCKSDVRCGNGYVDFVVGEMCDDGNALSHDGCSSNCLTETPAWKELRPQGGGPSLRDGHAMAYDPARGRLVLFGGRDNLGEPSTYFGDTWEWDGQKWLQFSGVTGPSARYLHLMAYAGQGKVLLIGGTGRSSADASTWEWNGARWQQVASAEQSPRAARAMAYDPSRRRVVLVGGGLTTWEWDGGRRRWESAGSIVGGPRAVGGLVFEPRLGRPVLFGADAQDVWQWNATTRVWERLPSSTPGPSAAPAAVAYDARRQRVVLMMSVSELWDWDGVTRAWTQRTPSGTVPEPRNRFAIAFHGPSERTLLFGGTAMSDLWAWSGEGWTQLAMPAPTGPTGFGALVYDASRGRTVLVRNGATAAETWGWSEQAWRLLPSTGSPVVAGVVGVAYDAYRGRVVMHSGDSRLGWEWDGQRWQALPALPSALPSAVATYDQAARKVRVFGGNTVVAGYSWNGAQWAAEPTLQARRIRPGLAYDAARACVVLFGGFDGTRESDETWELKADRWSRATPSATPPGEVDHALSFDARRQRMVLRGTNTWEWSGESWVDVTPVGAAPPATASQAYDAAQGMTLGIAANGALWAFQYQHPGARDEVCRLGFDVDGDGLIGCADPDCAALCTPLCGPGQACDPAAERCGDGVCNGALESCRMCPQDCGACPERCGDLFCDAGESTTSCPGDCL